MCEKMYERVKRMTKEELRDFIYYVYLSGNKDGQCNCEDSPSGYFGKVLDFERVNLMPNDQVDDLVNTWEL